jgi:hypothetical protein
MRITSRGVQHTAGIDTDDWWSSAQDTSACGQHLHPDSRNQPFVPESRVGVEEADGIVGNRLSVMISSAHYHWLMSYILSRRPQRTNDIYANRATSKVGVPGTPGTVDLTHALRRLTPKTSATAPSHDGHGWRTPDSIMSTGSRSGLSSLNSIHYPEKLKVCTIMII